VIFGLNLPNYSSLGNHVSMIAIAEKAEELGYSSLWTSDHILIPADLPEPFGNLLETFTTLSYLAARTETIRLGTGILVLPQRDPLLVAKQAATVHHLSGGRLVLGLGVGWIAQEYSFLRADFGSRGQLADEYIAAIRVLFESDRPAYHGDHINFSDVLFSPRPRTPIPIVVGGSSKPALRRAARLGDGWYGLRLAPEEAGRAIDEMNRIGHRPDFTLSLRLQIRVGGAVDGADPATTLHGDPEAVAEQLQKYSDIGIEQVVIEPFASDLADFIEQMSLFAHEVAPEFKRG
jgi:probable F420-dependent oxidoreductase